MRHPLRTVAVAGAVGAVGIAVARRAAAHSARRHAGDERWNVVTIQVADGALDESTLPAPVRELGDAIHWRTDPAPAGRGVELRVRADSSAPEPVSRDRIRIALREAKQLLEVGEVLQMDPRAHGARSATPSGALMDSIAGKSGGKGIL